MRALLLAILLLLPVVVAAPEPAAGDLIVTLREPMPAPRGALGVSVLPAFVLLDATHADAARWARDPRVERVDWARPLELHAAPALPAAAFRDLMRAEDDGLDGAGITVAVVDSGIDATHPDLAGRVRANGRLVAGRFIDAPGDSDGHGTHVAGIVGASGAASGGRWPGVAPGVDLVGVDISERFTTASAILAYDWLFAQREEHGIRVVVNAWGRVGEGELFDSRDPEIRAIDRLVRSGVVVLFSASNRGPGNGTLSIEAMNPNVITVGSTDAAALLADYSSRGPVSPERPWIKPDVVAPGDAVVGPRASALAPRVDDPDPLHTSYSGTSQAVPQVAGIVARMLQAQPDLTPQDVVYALTTSAIDLGEVGPDDATGYGMVDAADALRVARGLAPDRRNLLITGGAERYTDNVDVDGTPRRPLLDLVTPPPVLWETPIPVKPGTTSLRVEARAAGAGSLTVDLSKDGRSARGPEVSDPAPGIWLARVTGTLPITTRLEVTADMDLSPNPARALVLDGRRPPPPPEASALEGAVETAREHAPLALTALALGLVAAALWPRRRKDG